MRLLSWKILVIAEHKLEMENFPPVISVVTFEGNFMKADFSVICECNKIIFPTLHARLISP